MFVRAGGCLDLIDWLGDGWRRGGRPVAWVRWVGLPAGQLVAMVSWAVQRTYLFFLFLTMGTQCCLSWILSARQFASRRGLSTCPGTDVHLLSLL